MAVLSALASGGTLSSMTGFGRSDGAGRGYAWVWELRSINSRGLDVRVRMPPGLDGIEPALREAVAKRLQRGSVSASLSYDRQVQSGRIRLNEAVFQDVVKAADRAAELSGRAPADCASLLGIKGVLEFYDELEDAQERETREQELIRGFGVALDALVAARQAEGGRLSTVVGEQIDDIGRLAGAVKNSPSRTVEAVQARLQEMVSRLSEADNGVRGDRLHQEAVLMATKADVEEELARLFAHVAGAREILSSAGPVGRKLDFLAQEFNREANTLCSKAISLDVSRLGLELKTVIDQFREQVQNIE